jgi:hypothetical protein
VQAADARLARGIDAADQRRLDLAVGLLDEDQALQEGRGALDARHGLDGVAQVVLLALQAAGNGYRQVRVEVEDLRAPHLVEAGHDRQHDDEDGHAQQHAEHGEHGDHREEGALGLEVLQREKQ